MAKIIKEAAEQSYRLTIPNIYFKSNLQEIYDIISHYDYVLIAYEEQAKHGDLSHFKQIIKQFKTQDRVLMIFDLKAVYLIKKCLYSVKIVL